MATIRETFFDLVLSRSDTGKKVDFNPKNQAKLVSAVNAKDWIQVKSVLGSMDNIDLTKPPSPMTTPEQILYDVIPCLFEVFDISAPMNTIWALMDHLRAPDTEDGAREIAAKLNLDITKATDKDSIVAIIQTKSFAEVMKLVKATKEVVVDGVRFKAYYNYTSDASKLWERYTNGRAIWLVADEATMNLNTWMTFRDLAATRVAEASEMKMLRDEIAALKSAAAAPKGGSSKDKDAHVADLEAQLSAMRKSWTWSADQRQQVSESWAKIQLAAKCCYPDDVMVLTGTMRIVMQLAELRGPDAKNDLQSILDAEIARWDGEEHVDGVKNQKACDKFDFTNGWTQSLNSFCDKWMAPGANTGVKSKGKSRGYTDWFKSNFLNPVQSWWRDRVDSNKKVRDVVAEPAKDTYYGRFFANWKGALAAPMRAFAKDDGAYSGVSWTFGALASAVFAPFALVGMIGNLVGDGATKLFTDKTLTARWHSNWFAPGSKPSN